MNEVIGVLLTLFAGCFFFVGAFLSFSFKNKEKVLDFAMGLAFAVTIGIVVFDLLPESIQYFGDIPKSYKAFLVLTFIIFGMMILKIIDRFIPHHNHNATIEVNKHENHLYHIGIVTAISLLLHNAIEGFTIYTTTLTGITEGLILTLGVAAHNIPFGMQVSSMLQAGNAGKTKKYLIITLLAISGVFGAIAIIAAKSTIAAQTIGAIMSSAVGMLLYIALFELLGEIYRHSNKKVSMLGILIGFLLIVVTFVI